ncbi:MAG: PD-(D/E)XK nuclease family transposase, partial [Alphaproteobacteria bacterium]
IDKWMYFFKHGKETSEAESAKIIGSDDIIERAYSELNRFNWSEEELNTYEQEEKQERDHLSLMASKYDEGRAEGEAKGREEEREETARKMLELGMNVESIRKCTGLCLEKIKGLV